MLRRFLFPLLLLMLAAALYSVAHGLGAFSDDVSLNSSLSRRVYSLEWLPGEPGLASSLYLAYYELIGVNASGPLLASSLYPLCAELEGLKPAWVGLSSSLIPYVASATLVNDTFDVLSSSLHPLREWLAAAVGGGSLSSSLSSLGYPLIDARAVLVGLRVVGCGSAACIGANHTLLLLVHGLLYTADEVTVSMRASGFEALVTLDGNGSLVEARGVAVYSTGIIPLPGGFAYYILFRLPWSASGLLHVEAGLRDTLGTVTYVSGTVPIIDEFDVTAKPPACVAPGALYPLALRVTYRGTGVPVPPGTLLLVDGVLGVRVGEGGVATVYRVAPGEPGVYTEEVSVVVYNATRGYNVEYVLSVQGSCG